MTKSNPHRHASAPELQSLRGIFKVGPGDTVEDVRRARELMQTEAGLIPAQALRPC